jgi:hypothetical protein
MGGGVSRPPILLSVLAYLLKELARKTSLLPHDLHLGLIR